MAGNSQRENREGKSQVRINKKMRMWNKYKNYCFIGAGALAVVILVVVVVNLLPDDNGRPDYADNSQTQQETQADYISQLGTERPTQTEPVTGSAGTDGTGTDSAGTEQTQAPAQTETQAPAQTAGTAPVKETFTTKSKFDGAVFVGDTVVNGMSYYKYLNVSQVVTDNNMVSSQAAGYADTVMASNPSKVFIMVGLNDANYGNRTVDSVAGNIEKFVKAVKAKKSSTEVYVLSVLPVTQSFEAGHNVKQSFLNELNYALSTKASGMGAKYIDVATTFKDASGYMYTDCSGTGANLKMEYYPFLLNKIAAAI